jgi:hypothetical protein
MGPANPDNPADGLKELEDLAGSEYQKRLEVNRLRAEVSDRATPAPADLLADLLRAERELDEIEARRAGAEARLAPPRGVVLSTERTKGLLGAQTTGLEAEVRLRMEQVPTAISHLLDPAKNPLVSCTIRNARNEGIRRLRVHTSIEGYSAPAVDTVELNPLRSHEFTQLPILFPDRVRSLTELTRASLNVLIDDLDGKIEVHRSCPVWLLANTTAPLAVRDPTTGRWNDLTRYLGAFVTPNAPQVMALLRIAAGHHPDHRLVGYQVDPEGVEAQARAIYQALKVEGGITYVNSVIANSAEDGSLSQRVRLPRQSLEEGQANCIDGAVLFASLLEATSLSPALVIVPGHAFVAWETRRQSDQWRYLETTMVGDRTFEDARASAEQTARAYMELDQGATDSARRFRRWALRELRTDPAARITPME